MLWDIVAGLKPRTPEEGFAHAIKTWEGGYQAMPEDTGNWVTLPNGEERLVGTNLGVTPAALAKHRGKHPYEITEDDIRGLQIEEAVEIGMTHYYRAVGYDKLPWTPVTEVWVDIGWGSGPRTSIKHLQRLIGTGDDGVIGPYTIKAFTEWLRGADGLPSLEEHKRAVSQTYNWRASFYRDITRRRPANKRFLRGWLNRARYYTPGTSWWGEWIWA